MHCRTMLRVHCLSDWTMNRGNLLPGLVFMSCLLGNVMAADFKAGPDDYRSYLALLKPGDRLLLEGGDYFRGLPLHDLQGLPEHPIVIEGPQTKPAARFIARAGANTVSLANVRHLVIRNLELDGRNLPVDAVKAEGHASFAHHVTLENLRIIGHGNNQQTVGISTKCPAKGWIIRNNFIEGAGTGIYLGNSDGSAPFWAGLIENNQVLDSPGYNLQIKHQKARPVEYLEDAAPAATIIRNNFFRKSSNSSIEKMARPNVLLGHFPLQGAGSDDRYLVYGNLFLNNPTEALFQAEGRLALYNNIFINATGDAIHIQPHNDIPRDMEIFYNTVLASGAGIIVREPQQVDVSYTQRVTGNVVAAETTLQVKSAAYNLQMPYQPDLAMTDKYHKLTASLIKRSRNRKDLPARLVRNYEAYLDWDKEGAGKRQNVLMPGAVLSREIDNWILRGDASAPISN